jgi:hypothetical protein
MNSKLIFYGNCPECSLKGYKVKMRLNKNDFFESEETGLQVYLITGNLAVILNERGKGNFLETKKYADEFVTTEILVPQNKLKVPFVDDIVYFKNNSELSDFISKIG